MAKRKKVTSRIFVSPTDRVGRIWNTYPYARKPFRLLGINEDNIHRYAQLTFSKALELIPDYGWNRDTVACRVNTLIGFSGGPPLDLKEWVLRSGPPSTQFIGDGIARLKLDEEGLALVSAQGLPAGSFRATHNHLGLCCRQRSGGIDRIACWPWASHPCGRETMFGEGFIRWGHGSERNKFKDVKLRPFGFENAYGNGRANRSRLALEHKVMVLEVSGRGNVWVELNPEACVGTLDPIEQSKGVARMWKQLGWDSTQHCYWLYVSDTANSFAGDPMCPPAMDVPTAINYIGYDPTQWGRTDDLIAGNVYFAFAAGVGPPIDDKDGRHRWSGKRNLTLIMAAGMSYEDALANLNRVRSRPAETFARRLQHCCRVATQSPTITAQDHPNLEAMATTLVLQMDSMGLEGDKLKGQADGAYIDACVIMWSAPGYIYAGFEKTIDKFISFATRPEHSGPNRRLSAGWHYHYSPSNVLHQITSDDFNSLSTTGLLHWRDSDDFFAEHRYPERKEMLNAALAEADGRTGFLQDSWGGDATLDDYGLPNGLVYNQPNIGAWYGALRTFEVLAMELGDDEFAVTLRQVSEKVHRNYLKTFYDPNYGFLAHMAYVDGKRPSIFEGRIMGYNLYTTFHEELVAGKERALAENGFRMLFDKDWKQIRLQAREGKSYPSIQEMISYAWHDSCMARAFRLGRHAEGLKALREGYEFYYGKFDTVGETFNMWPHLSAEHQADFYPPFNYGLACYYQIIIEGFFGITTGAGGIGLSPVGLDSDMKLEGLRYGRSLWNFNLSGTGPWPSLITLNGNPVKGTWCLPKVCALSGVHDVDIAFDHDPPKGPVVLETPGLGLVESSTNRAGNVARVTLCGPGRSWVRYFSPTKPKVYFQGKQIPDHWRRSSQEGRVEVMVESTAESAELRVHAGA